MFVCCRFLFVCLLFFVVVVVVVVVVLGGVVVLRLFGCLLPSGCVSLQNGVCADYLQLLYLQYYVVLNRTLLSLEYKVVLNRMLLYRQYSPDQRVGVGRECECARGGRVKAGGRVRSSRRAVNVLTGRKQVLSLGRSGHKISCRLKDYGHQ